MSHSFSTHHLISEQGTRHAHPRASAAAMSRHVQRSHRGYTLTHAGHQIRIGPVASTLRACAEAAVTQQESEYLAALDTVRTFGVDANGVTFFRADGGIAVTMARP